MKTLVTLNYKSDLLTIDLTRLLLSHSSYHRTTRRENEKSLNLEKKIEPLDWFSDRNRQNCSILYTLTDNRLNCHENVKEKKNARETTVL